jgi:two-component sensor histidine kinase
MVAGKATSCPIPLRARDGTLIPVDTKVTLGKWDDRDVLFGISRDIAERVRAEEALQRYAERLETLHREVNHRVGNNLTAIIGLLHAEKRHISPEHGDANRDVLDRLIQRVEGMAEVHRMLSSSQWSPLRLDHLVYQISQVALSALPVHQTIQTTITPTEITVSPRQASMLALIVNELTTNTVKHAMAGRSHGRIGVSIDVMQDQVHLQFRNDGPGYPDEVLRLEKSNVGLYLVGQLILSLPGELTLSNDGGAVTTIVFEREKS